MQEACLTYVNVVNWSYHLNENEKHYHCKWLIIKGIDDLMSTKGRVAGRDDRGVQGHTGRLSVVLHYAIIWLVNTYQPSEYLLTAFCNSNRVLRK